MQCDWLEIQYDLICADQNLRKAEIEVLCGWGPLNAEAKPHQS